MNMKFITVYITVFFQQEQKVGKEREENKNRHKLELRKFLKVLNYTKVLLRPGLLVRAWGWVMASFKFKIELWPLS